ncbi:response regulator [Roseovarius nanhaiticus]|uniref:Response regulator receiver protein n=1 Tax=Roseovarius nanhaiticus TaxID=573024 RepID=A0A1N7H0I4_9RHOB|nr:response regulator [Roseovarius nanhaiticus]SEL17327.1 response regulator receiver protein [Roseovarius nanhaiticus]SIS18349.1 response regulator receiver protein [Roseovarius nanhaiticus]
MTTSDAGANFSQQIAHHLPYLRRYARALTGSQSSGDAFATTTLEAILMDRDAYANDASPRVALFRAFRLVWQSAGAPDQQSDMPMPRSLETAAQGHMAQLTPDTRQALLLNSIEEFSAEEIGQIMDISTQDAEDLIAAARREIEESMAGDVLVIEDEAIIAMDLHSIVTSIGHNVTGIGRTRDAAIELGLKKTPNLILADIQLADNSSGIDAVNALLQQIGDIPVIFITAFPERLLTGDKPEPAFVIAKPYTEDQVRSAVGQAMFFSSTETLKTA